MPSLFEDEPKDTADEPRHVCNTVSHEGDKLRVVRDSEGYHVEPEIKREGVNTEVSVSYPTLAEAVTKKGKR